MTSGRTPIALALSICFVAGLSPVLAQDTLRVDVDLVSVVATVTDARGAYVQGLKAEDFVVVDDGVAQEISYFTEEGSLPVSLGIALDISGSMFQRMGTALAALDRFVVGLHEDDEVFVTTFSNRVSFIDRPTSDRASWADELMRVDVAGGTALYDAVAATIERIQEGKHSKRSVVILTDGSDTMSEKGLADTIDLIRRSEVLVYALGIDTLQFADDQEHVRFDWPLTPIPGVPGLRAPSWMDDPVDLRVLEAFARASGGKAFLVSGTWTDGSDEEISAVLDEVTAELRSQYTLGYYPSETSDGRLHELRIRVPGSDYTVRARASYRSPDPQ